MLRWLRARTEARNAKELHVTVMERHAALAREKGVREQLDAALRDILGYRDKIASITQIAGEIAARRAALMKENEGLSARVGALESLLEHSRSVSELALELSSNGKTITVYERAEKAGLQRELTSISIARGAIRGMNVSKKVALARSDILLERLSQVGGKPDYSEINDVDEDEDTKQTKLPKAPWNR